MSGRPEAVLTTEQGEIAQGDDAAREVEEQIGFIANTELADYVRELGQRLAKQSPRKNIEHHFYVVNMIEPNAFALPGGHIYVSRGLLARMNSEDELANVLGHEIGHVAARHSVSRQAASAPMIPIQIAAGLGGALTSIVAPRLGQIIAGAGQLPGALAMAAYSREQEREADRLGQQFAAGAGWDPVGLSTFMHSLGREAALDPEGDKRMHFLESHPTSPDRSAAALEYSHELEVAKDAPAPLDVAAFFDRLDGLVVGPRAMDGVFIESRFLHPDLGFGFTLPEEWNYNNTQTAVVAVSGSGNSHVALQLAGDGDDPMKYALELGQDVKFKAEPEVLEINGLSAVKGIVEKVRMGQRELVAQHTWIASRGIVYRISGVSAASIYPDVVGIFGASARSFHALSPAEFDEISEFRLRIEVVGEGDDIEKIAERSGTHWSPEVLAIANGLELTDSLEPGRLIKVARQEHYEPPVEEAAPDSDGEED